MKKRAETARARGRLMRSSSSTLHPSVSMYSNSDSLSPFSRNRSNSSEASSSGDTSERLSPFRARSYSNASSASQSSVAQVTSHIIKHGIKRNISQLSEFHGLGSINDDLSTDLEEIDMSDLSLGCDFIREYLSPATTSNNAPMTPDTNYDQHCSQQNVTVTENMDQVSVILSHFPAFRFWSLETTKWCVSPSWTIGIKIWTRKLVKSWMRKGRIWLRMNYRIWSRKKSRYLIIFLVPCQNNFFEFLFLAEQQLQWHGQWDSSPGGVWSQDSNASGRAWQAGEVQQTAKDSPNTQQLLGILRSTHR